MRCTHRLFSLFAAMLVRSYAIALLTLPLAGSVEAQRPVHSSGLVSRIDHVMYPGGPELGRLVELLRDKLELPVVFGGPTQTPPMPGVCFSFGNTCLEVVPLRADPADPPPAARIGSLALEAETFDAVIDSLIARGIDHFPPAQQARWTTIGLREFGGGMFFIEYRSGMSQRRQRFRRVLDERHGGPLGIVRMVEVSRTIRNLDEVRDRWTRLFGAPLTGDPYVWTVKDGPAVRLVPVDDSLGNRIVVEVRSIAAAAEALRRLGLPFVEANGAIAIDSAALLGLRLVLVPASRGATARCELSPRPYGLGGWCHLDRGDSATAQPLRLRFADSARIWMTAGPGDDPPWRGDLALPGLPTSFELVREQTGPSRHRLVFRTGIAWLLVREWRELDAGSRGCSACDRSVKKVHLILDLIEHPPPTEDDVVILQDALAKLDGLARWNRAEEQTCGGSGTAPTGLFCLLYLAVEERMGRYHHRQPALEIVRSVIQERWPERISGHRLIDLNNHPATTIYDLRALLELALARARATLDG